MTNQLIEQLGSALQQRGLRMTQARRTILASLVSCQGHITADDLYEVVHQEQPGISRMSVYRTLDLLSELGLIRPVYQGTAAAHYILLDEGHHHHLVCSNCDKVIELEDCVLKKVENSLGRRFNFEIQGHLLEFFGLCEDCRTEMGN